MLLLHNDPDAGAIVRQHFWDEQFDIGAGDAFRHLWKHQ